MADQNSIDFRVSVKDDGLPGLKALTGGLDAASTEAQQLSAQASEVLEQLRGVGQQQQAIQVLQDISRQGRDLGSALNIAAAQVERLGGELQSAKDALESTDGASKEAAKQVKALEREYAAAVAAAKRASAAVGENQRAMDAARQAAKDLGIDTAKLATEKRRLEQAAQEARKGLDGVAASAERLLQRQAEADKVLKDFQADLRKLTTEGPQAPAGLEEAFKRLGINGVKKAETAVHELQIALAQIRNSADVMPKDKEAAVAAFKQRVTELRKEAGPAADATSKLGGSADGAGNALGAAAKKALAWTGAIVGLSQLKGLAEDVIATGSAFENLETRLGNLLGGTEAAGQAMAMIKDLASTTPFAVTDMADAFIKLTAFGLQPSEQQMRALADVAANLGGGTEVLTGVTLALGQAWTKGKLQGEELMQLAERGVPVWDALAAATGRSVPELQKMSAAGELGRDVISKLIDELGRMNAGASDELMKTFSGAVSNAKDALEEFFNMIAESGALDWLTNKLRELLKEFDRMKETGELQEVAQDIADGFIAVAETAEVVTRTLIDMAPAIELAVTAWLGFKAINLATTLYTTAAAMVATGAASTGAAAGMTAAAVATNALAVAIKRLLAATGIGLILVAIGEIGIRLLGVGDDAKKAGDDVEEGMGKAAAATEKAADASKSAAKEQQRLAREAAAASAERAKAEKEAAEAEVDAVEARAIARRTDAAVALQELETRRLLASQSEEMARAVGDETGAIQARVTMMEIDLAISEAKIAVQRVEAENAIALAEAKLAEASASNELTAAKEAELQGAIRLAEAKLKESDAQTEGLKLLQENLDKTKDAIRNGATYRDVTDGAADATKRLGAEAEVTGDRLEGMGRKGRQAGSETEQAFKRAGVSMQKDLDAAAVQAEKDFELIRNSGQANADGVAKAWRRMTEAQIAANGGVATEAQKAEAAMYGLEIQVDSTGKAVVRNMGDAAAAVDGFTKGVQRAQEQLKKLKELQGFARAGGDLSEVSTEDLKKAQSDLLKEGGALSSTEYTRMRNELMSRQGAKTDKDGFSLDGSGNRLTMGGDLTTLTGIKNFLQQAGLDEEQAKRVAREFSDGKGEIPYIDNPGQRKYGGDFSTMSEALLKAAERITFGMGGAGGTPVGRTVTVRLDGGRGRREEVKTDEAGASALIRALENSQLRS